MITGITLPVDGGYSAGEGVTNGLHQIEPFKSFVRNNFTIYILVGSSAEWLGVMKKFFVVIAFLLIVAPSYAVCS